MLWYSILSEHLAYFVNNLIKSCLRLYYVERSFLWQALLCRASVVVKQQPKQKGLWNKQQGE